jgi:hypothetical protein
MAIPAMAPELRLLLADELLATVAVALDLTVVKVTVAAFNVTVNGLVVAPNVVEGLLMTDDPCVNGELVDP